jgi:glycosyltransferase involved in cell wall biosynthesis
LRIGVNALYLIPGGVGGTEIYLRHLLRELGELDGVNEYIVFTNQETGTRLAPERPNFRHAPQPVRAVVRPARILWEQTGLAVAAMSHRVDVMLNPGFTAPVLRAAPNVTVFHDLQHKRHPEYFRWFDLPFWRLCLWAAAHSSRLILADSEATRADLLRFYRLRADRVRTVPLGVDPRFFGLARNPSRFFLCASTLHPHKNIGPLIRAFGGFSRKHDGFRLVITGVRGFETAAIEALVADLGLGETVRLAGWVPREELYGLFSEAFALLYPSTFEGFGLPVVEAMAAGVPTACSAIEPLASMAGSAALQFEPGDPEAIEGAFERLALDDALRARLTLAGPVRAREFSWRRTAELTLQALTEAAGRTAV